MKVLWFPRLPTDADTLHYTTWREMVRNLESLGCTVKIALTGKDNDHIMGRDCIEIFLIRKKILRILSFLISGYFKFVYNYFVFKPDVVLLDAFSVWFSIPFIFFPGRKTVFIVDHRTPFYYATSDRFTLQDRIMRLYTGFCFMYCKLFLDGTTVITEYYKEYVHRNYKVPLASVGVWGSGVDTEKFHPYIDGKLNRPDFLRGKFVLMQHGGFTSNRGLMESIEAVGEIENEDICFVLLGEGAYKPELIQKIEESGIAGRVHILPPVPHSEIPKYINYCDCAIMAYPDIEYWNNNNPIKLLEYLATGKVVICTDMWTFSDVAGKSRCAYYIKDNRPETISDAIRYCYANKDSLDEWGKEGIDIVKKRFTWHDQAKRLISFIRQLQKTRCNS